MALHRIHHPHPLETGQTLQVSGEEAHHAIRVKRIEAGEMLELLNARGAIAAARVARTFKLPKSDPDGPWAMELVIESVRTVPPPACRIEVCVAPPKGDRLDQLIDQLSQVGADAWVPLASAHSVTDPAHTRVERLQRIAFESMKQCGRAWALEILPAITFAEALGCGAGSALVLADASGGGLAVPSAPAVRVLIGPEGGFSASEIEQARAAGASVARLGPHILRMETAAVLATGMLRAAASPL